MFRSEKKSAIHSPQFLPAPPGTCPRFRPTHSKKSAIRTLPNIWVVSPGSCPSTEKKGQRDPHSSQLTEVSIPKLSLHNFCHFGPAPSQDSGSEKKKVRSAPAHAPTQRKKNQGPKGAKGPRANGSKGQRVQGPRGQRARGSKGQGPRPKARAKAKATKATATATATPTAEAKTRKKEERHP